MPLDFEKLIADIDPAFKQETVLSELKEYFPDAMNKIGPAVWCYVFNIARVNQDKQGVNVSINALMATVIYFAIALKDESVTEEVFTKTMLDAMREMIQSSFKHEKDVREAVPHLAGSVGLHELLSFANNRNVEILQEIAQTITSLTKEIRDGR